MDYWYFLSVPRVDFVRLLHFAYQEKCHITSNWRRLTSLVRFGEENVNTGTVGSGWEQEVRNCCYGNGIGTGFSVMGSGTGAGFSLMGAERDWDKCLQEWDRKTGPVQNSSVCLTVCEHISRTTQVIFTNCFCAYYLSSWPFSATDKTGPLVLQYGGSHYFKFYQ